MPDTSANTNPRVLNLGAGVQSTTVLLLMVRGRLEPADLAVFADTGWEPPAVYDHLDWLEGVARSAGIRVARVQNGNLRDDALQHRNAADDQRKRWASLPLFVRNADGSIGIVRRQCTKEYKIQPIDRFVRRELLGLEPGQRVPKGVHVTQLFGISADEIRRMKRSTDAWRSFHYPLVEDFVPAWSRDDCLRWLAREFPERAVPRSACIGCPFHSNAEWRRMRDDDPELFEDACRFDDAIRNLHNNRSADGGDDDDGAYIKGEVFVHRSATPLRTADLGDAKAATPLFDGLGFDNECDGMCGV